MNRVLPLGVWCLCSWMSAAEYDQWRVAGGTDNTHYSTLKQINRENVGKLQRAWAYDSKDAFDGSEMQCNPIIVDGVLYATTPRLRLFALNAATGRELWTFNPNGRRTRDRRARNRGVTYWAGEGRPRIYYAVRQFLYAVDARSGQPVSEFGDRGRVDLRQGLGREEHEVTISVTSAGVIYRDLLIVGSIVGESLPSAPGDIRAYDLRTGKLRWSFHTIPHPGEFGYETWPKEGWKYLGGANNWSGMVVDQSRGLVFIPTGSAAFDFYGANRVGDNLFANSLLCLKAATGERVWHFQAVRHDVWDRDFPAAPALVQIHRGGKSIDAVAQISKSGYVWLFERETGKSVFPMRTIETPASDVDGEVLAKSQVVPSLPPPFSRQEVTARTLTQRTPAAHKAVLAQFRKLRSGSPFAPPSREGTIVFPGFDGGGEWGGPSFDPETGWLYVNANEMAWILRLVPKPPEKSVTSGYKLYKTHCASCHREDRQGSPPEFPSLIQLASQRTQDEISDFIRDGGGRMPGFRQLGDDAISALTRYVATGEDKTVKAQQLDSAMELAYTHDGYNKFLDPDGYPAVAPPWGTLSAIDINQGKIVWQKPFGEFPELAAAGMSNTGSENYGGSVVTAGGLLFIGATDVDRKFRAFDKKTGKVLWETVLPASGNATPATYQIDGKQYVVIGAGGGKWGQPSGGSYIAFALPD